MNPSRRRSIWTLVRFGVPFVVVLSLLTLWPRTRPIAAQAQPPRPTEQELDERANRDAARSQEQATAAEADDTAASEEQSLNPLHLYREGGFLMHPIALLSFVVVLVSIERAMALRRSRVMPEELVESLGQIAGSKEGFDPKKAYRACQQFPSAASNVIRAMLLKVGRPHSEVEHAVAQASDREATVLYGNIRWLTLSASVGPLLGLLGTVWGMILAFYVTATAPIGVNKAQMLASGIYMALVTTFAGLCVAIPAVIISYWLEGRIHTLFREVDDLAGTLLPHVERYEGKLRATPRSLAESDRPVEAAVVAGPK